MAPDAPRHLFILAAPVAVLTAGAAIAERRPVLVVVAIGVVIVGWIAHRIATVVLQKALDRLSGSWFGIATAWTLAAYAAATTVLLSCLVVPSVSLGVADREAVSLLLGASGIKTLAFAGALFGGMMAFALAADDAIPWHPWTEGLTPRSFFGIAAVIVLIRAGFVTLARDTAVVVPETKRAATQLLPELQREASRRPRNAHALYALGRALSLTGGDARAVPVLTQAAKLDSNNASIRNGLGWSLLQQRRVADAIPHLKKATELDNDYFYAWQNLGWAYFTLDSLAQARRAYSAASRVRPQDPAIAYQFASVLNRLHDERAALAQARRALRFDPANVEVQGLAAYLMRSQGQFAEAKAHFEAATRLAPQDPRAWADLGVTDYLLHDEQGALAAFDSTVRRDSTYLKLRPPMLAMRDSARLHRK